jgi:hypothetical protein
MRGLEDGVWEGGFGEGLFDIAFTVVVHEFAESGMEDRAVDELPEVGFGEGECSFDHILPKGFSIVF